MKKTIIFFAIFMAIISIANAQQPFLQESQTGTIDIETPIINPFNINYDYDFHIHAFNSTGHPLDDTTTSCYIHLYNSTGNHILKEEMTFDGMEWETTIPKQNFTQEGQYAVITWCNNTKEGGFIAETSIGTNTGNINQNPTAIIIGLGIIFTILIILIFAFDSEHWALKLLLVGFIIILIPAIINILIQISPAQTITNLLTTIYKTTTNLIWMFGIYIVLYIAWIAFLNWTPFGKEIRLKIKRK